MDTTIEALNPEEFVVAEGTAQPAEWEVRQGLLIQLVNLGVDLELACDIVTRIHVDLPEHIDSAVINTLLTQHTRQLGDMVRRVQQMTKPLFTRKARLHRLPDTSEKMLGNLADHYQISLLKP